MEKRETLLFYLIGLVGLVVVSILSTDQIERVEIRPLPTPTIALTSQSTALSPQINWIGEGYPPPKLLRDCYLREAPRKEAAEAAHREAHGAGTDEIIEVQEGQ